MSSFELAIKVIEAALPEIEGLAGETSKLASIDSGARMPLGQVVWDGVQEQFQLNSNVTFRGSANATATERLAQAVRDEPEIPFSGLRNSENFGLTGPRQLIRDTNLDADGGMLHYETTAGHRVSVTVPSISELQHAPTDELTALIRDNRRSLLSALDHVKPGQFPKLGWHGTSVEGKNFLFAQRQSFSRVSSGPASLWVHTPLYEGVSPGSYLSDTQHMVASSSGIVPYGETATEHSLVVVDRSMGDWTWDQEQKAWRQRLSREPYPVQENPLDRFFGAQTPHLGKTQVDVNPDNFDANILGSFDDTPRPIDLDVRRNYFDKWKFQRLGINSALSNQESVANSWDLAGFLRRIR